MIRSMTGYGRAEAAGARTILSDVSFAVHAEDRIALVGVNGS